MTETTLQLAINEAVQFVTKASVLQRLIEVQKNDPYSSCNPKESGSVRRASMDLTRALADLRRAN